MLRLIKEEQDLVRGETCNAQQVLMRESGAAFGIAAGMRCVGPGCGSLLQFRQGLGSALIGSQGNRSTRLDLIDPFAITKQQAGKGRFAAIASQRKRVYPRDQLLSVGHMGNDMYNNTRFVKAV